MLLRVARGAARRVDVVGCRGVDCMLCGCLVSAARCTLHVACCVRLLGVCCMLHVVSGLSSSACRLSYVVGCMLSIRDAHVLTWVQCRSNNIYIYIHVHIYTDVYIHTYIYIRAFSAAPHTHSCKRIGDPRQGHHRQVGLERPRVRRGDPRVGRLGAAARE